MGPTRLPRPTAAPHTPQGEKIYYLARPTAANLGLFEAWGRSRNQGQLFFGDQVDRCYRCPLRQGQTLFIPTGMGQGWGGVWGGVLATLEIGKYK